MPSYVMSVTLHSVSDKEKIPLEANIPTAYMKRTQIRFRRSKVRCWESMRRLVDRAST